MTNGKKFARRSRISAADRKKLNTAYYTVLVDYFRKIRPVKISFIAVGANLSKDPDARKQLIKKLRSDTRISSKIRSLIC